MFSHPLWVSLFVAHVHAAAQTFFPAGIPLSVRSPYMSVWHDSANTSSPLPSAYPIFWSSANIGWSGKIRVDGTLYSWMGAGQTLPNVATVTHVEITPTRSIYTMEAGTMNLTITFLSPIELTDWVKQSIPFSYVSVEAVSLDGVAHAVQLYSDINAEWLSGFGGSIAKWTTITTSSSIYHEILPPEAVSDIGFSHQAEDGTAYYAMPHTQGLTWQVDRDNVTTQQFTDHGVLTNTSSTVFGPIVPDVPVFAFSVDLGTIKSTSSPVTWSVGYVRDPSVLYTTGSGTTEMRRPYYATQYSNISTVIDAVVEDASAAHDRAIALDAKIMADAAKISPEYVDLVSLATRQILGSLDITVLSDGQSGVNASDVKIFMKNMGDDQRVNPVETMYSAWPAFLYLNATLFPPMLAPLLESQEALNGQSHASPDLGTTYPIANGEGLFSSAGVEDSGDMLIIMLAYAQATGDGSLLARYYGLLKQWTDYLVSNTLFPENQVSGDDEDGDNLANLALKGIIGVKAMAEISSALGNAFDADSYSTHADSLITSWQSLALSADKTHILTLYGDPQSSWSLSYNLYADRLLGTNLVPSSVLANHTKFLGSLLETAPPFGLSIDTRDGRTTSIGWLLFTAAAMADQGVRDGLIHLAWAKASFNVTQGIFSDFYNGVSGRGEDFASPGVGGIFSLLGTTPLNTTISPTGPSNNGHAGNGGGNTDSEDTAKNPHVGVIVGGVVGGVAVVAGAVLVAFCLGKSFKNNRRRMSWHTEARPTEIMQVTPARRSRLPFDGCASEVGSATSTEIPNLHWAFVPTDISVTQVDSEDATTQHPSAGPSTEDVALAGASIQVHMSGIGSSVLSPVPRPEVFAQSAGSDLALLSTTEVVGVWEEVQELRGLRRQLHAARFEQPPAYTA